MQMQYLSTSATNNYSLPGMLCIMGVWAFILHCIVLYRAYKTGRNEAEILEMLQDEQLFITMDALSSGCRAFL